MYLKARVEEKTIILPFAISFPYRSLEVEATVYNALDKMLLKGVLT